MGCRIEKACDRVSHERPPYEQTTTNTSLTGKRVCWIAPIRCSCRKPVSEILTATGAHLVCASDPPCMFHHVCVADVAASCVHQPASRDVVSVIEHRDCSHGSSDGAVYCDVSSSPVKTPIDRLQSAEEAPQMCRTSSAEEADDATVDSRFQPTQCITSFDDATVDSRFQPTQCITSFFAALFALVKSGKYLLLGILAAAALVSGIFADSTQSISCSSSQYNVTDATIDPLQRLPIGISVQQYPMNWSIPAVSYSVVYARATYAPQIMSVFCKVAHEIATPTSRLSKVRMALLPHRHHSHRRHRHMGSQSWRFRYIPTFHEPNDVPNEENSSSPEHSDDDDEFTNPLIPLPCIVPGCNALVLTPLETGRIPCTSHRCTSVNGDGKQCWGVNDYPHACPTVTATTDFLSSMSRQAGRSNAAHAVSHDVIQLTVTSVGDPNTRTTVTVHCHTGIAIRLMLTYHHLPTMSVSRQLTYQH